MAPVPTPPARQLWLHRFPIAAGCHGVIADRLNDEP